MTVALTDQTEELNMPQRGKAGRNLPAAIGIGLALSAAVLVTLLLYRPAFGALVTVVVALAIHELVRAISAVEARPPFPPLLVGGVAMQWVAWFAGAEGLAVGFFLTTAACLVWRLAEGPIGCLRDTATAVFIALYVPLLAGFVMLMAVADDGVQQVVVYFTLVACSDIAAYSVGVFFGRHPMAPMVSPKKSWEGSSGSVVACVIAGAILLPLLLDATVWQGVIYGLVIAVVATLGDLGESMIKRDLGIKDMGTLLPGHGGVMDRLDSLLPCAAVSYLLLLAFA